MVAVIPIILFAYARPDHLRRTLDSLRADAVPMIYAFSDGPRTQEKTADVLQVRQILREVDWCEVIINEREENFGLGRSILDGVSTVLRQYEAGIVFEDDLICVPGTYRYLCAALEHYKDDPAVMSVTAWTHPRTVPSSITAEPYFDGRAECWTWGTWARSWQGMNRDAKTLLKACKKRGIDEYRYGADLVAMAEVECQKNIWAVRFAYLHMLNGGLCLRPPHSMVEHIGFDGQATNANVGSNIWANPPLQASPSLPECWPVAVENPECPYLWQLACGYRPSVSRQLVDVFRRPWHRMNSALRPHTD